MPQDVRIDQTTRSKKSASEFKLEDGQEQILRKKKDPPPPDLIHALFFLGDKQTKNIDLPDKP